MFEDKDVYLIGIGGCGMSGLARMVAEGKAAGQASGITHQASAKTKSTGEGGPSAIAGSDRQVAGVMGSDSMVTPVTAALEAEGIQVEKDDAPLPESVGVVIASAAIDPDHVQMLAAQERGLEVLTYAEALGQCMASRTGVALAGTHGKSTTTAMLGTALVDAGLDPSVIVGALCGQLADGAMSSGNDESGAGNGATGFRLGATDIPRGSMNGKPGFLLCEACEFNRSFHNLRPTIASISAVEADHLDIYGSLDAVIEAFAHFAQLVPSEDEGGKLLIAHEGAHRREITAGVSCSVETIGFSPSADWSVIYEPDTRHVTLSYQREVVATWGMLLPGEHNAMNAATACAMAIMLGAEAEVVADSLGKFKGVQRRTEFLGLRRIDGTGMGAVRVWDDYGHHPTEIEKTLRALRDFERPEETGGRLICVFQPHQHSRTRFFLDEFATSFENADIVIVPHIYFVRDSEAEKHKVSSADLVDRLRSRGVRAMHVYPFDAIVEQLESVCRAGDVLVSMGAGPVCEVARGFMASAPDAPQEVTEMEPELEGVGHASHAR